MKVTLSDETISLIEIAKKITEQTELLYENLVTNIEQEQTDKFNQVYDSIFIPSFSLMDNVFMEIGKHIERNIEKQILEKQVEIKL